MNDERPRNDQHSFIQEVETIPEDLIQIHQDMTLRQAGAVSLSIAVGIGVMAVLGRFVFSYDPRVNVMGYLWMIFFMVPLMITYLERFEALGGSKGLYGLVRNRFGLTITFLTGWLELAGYAAVIITLARMIVMYSLTMYEAFGGHTRANVVMLSVAMVVIMILWEMVPISGFRKATTLIISTGLVILFALGGYSLFNYRSNLVGMATVLKTVKPFHLSALLLSSFWAIILLYSFRRQVFQSNRLVRRLGWVVMFTTILLGAFLSLATVPVGSVENTTKILSVNNLSAIIFTGDPVFTVIIAIFAITAGLVGVSRALRQSAAVMEMMTQDAFFPQFVSFRIRHTSPVPFIFIMLLTAILAFSMSTMTIVGLASAFLAAATILIHLPDIFTPVPKLPPNRSTQLPLHPLFPALTVVASTLALVNIGRDVLTWSGLWLLIGGVLFTLYAYRAALHRRGKERTFAEDIETPAERDQEATQGPEGPWVLLPILHLDNLAHHIRIGHRVAQQLESTLILMHIIPISEDLTPEARKELGIQHWKTLIEALKQQEELQDILTHIKPMVRMTSHPIRGLINAAQELAPQYLIVPPDFMADDPTQNIEDYDTILMDARTHVIFLNRMELTQEAREITVLIGAGTNAPLMLNLAQGFLAPDGVLHLLHVLPENTTQEEEAKIRSRIMALVHSLDLDEKRVRLTLTRMPSIEKAVEIHAAGADLLILGAPRNFLTLLPTFTGVNPYLFRHTSIPTIIVSTYRKTKLDWLARIWESITRPLPKLTFKEREEVVRDIIAGADPSVDFFILILLSSGIAIYGLLQNSGAVIIGAMLVAPLMSPIIAVAMSMVRGDLKHLRISLQATAQGVLLAISVGAVLTFFSPIKTPTNEILSRVNPNLLDLGIAFLSGAAGGYAMSRKSIAAALPGVAIAAALVPPLTVVGYGFATADLGIAFGALLLFITNFIAIILAAALVFLALDFVSPEKKTWGEVVRGLKITAVFLVVVVIILGWVTYQSVVYQQRLRAIQDVLAQSVYSKSFEPLELEIKGNRHGFRVEAILLSYDQPLTAKELNRLGKELEAAVGAPVTADLKVISAQKGTIHFDTAVTSTQIEEALAEMLADLPVESISIQVDPVGDGYQATLLLAEYQPHAISQTWLQETEEALAKEFHAPITIQIMLIPVEKLESQASIMPIPTATVIPTPTPTASP